MKIYLVGGAVRDALMGMPLQVWMATGKRVNLAAKVFDRTTDLHAMGVLKGARRASFKTPMAWQRNSRDVVICV